MLQRKFHFEVLFCFLGLFIAVQLFVFFTVKKSFWENNLDHMEHELGISSRSFEQLLNSEMEALTLQTALLVEDFAFKQAFATDAPTRLSALMNLKERIQADRMLLFSMDAGHPLIADTLKGDAISELSALHFEPVFKKAEDAQAGSHSLIWIDGVPSQFALVPLLAPMPIAWVGVIQAIDKQWATDTAALIGCELALIFGEEQAESLQVGVSTFPETFKSQLPDGIQGLNNTADAMKRLSIGGADFGMVKVKASDEAPVVALLGSSIDAKLAVYSVLERNLLLLIGCGALLFIVGALVLARALSEPLRKLVKNAESIGQGNLGQQVVIKGASELLQLADMLNWMSRQLKQRMDELLQLNASVQKLSSHLSTEDIVSSALESMERLYQPEAVGLFLSEEINNGAVAKIQGSPRGKALLEGNAPTIKQRNVRVVDGLTVVTIPILAKERSLGALCLVLAEEEREIQTERAKASMDLFVRQLATSLENAWLYQLSQHDQLTGLYNHSAFERHFDVALQQASSNASKVSLVVIAIDQFSELTNTLGQAQGGEVIKAIAAILKKECRSLDTVARRGNEVFEVSLPFTDFEKAEDWADVIRSEVEETQFFPSNADIVTVSIGIAEYPQDGNRASNLFQAADQALEHARVHGGNQIIQSIDSEKTVSDNDGLVAPYVFASVKMQQVVQNLRRVASSSIPVFLQGETGVGKEVLADSVHRLSRRRNKPFIKLNCGSVPENLIESELFGHERGAFTGANQRRIGRFEEAHGGTIFLDEIVDMPINTQVKLLRVLEEKKIVRLGSNKEIPTDVRLVSASNKDVFEAIQNGTFREDLFFRLNAMVVQIPPLRERQEDIPELMDRFLEQLNKENEGSKTMAPDVYALFQQYQWPGNIRELRNILERAYHESTRTTITKSHIHFNYRKGGATSRVSPIGRPPVTSDDESPDLKTALENYEKELLISVLKRNNGNIIKTAKILNVSRSRIYRKLEKFAINTEGELISKE